MLKVSKGMSNSPGLSIVHSDNLKTLVSGSYNIQTWSPLTSYFPAPMLVCQVSTNRLSMSKPCLHYKCCLVLWFCCLRELSARHFHHCDPLCTLTAPSVRLNNPFNNTNVFIFIFTHVVLNIIYSYHTCIIINFYKSGYYNNDSLLKWKYPILCEKKDSSCYYLETSSYQLL